MKPGDAVLFRSVYRGRVQSCAPNHYVDRLDDRHLLYLQPRSEGRWIRDGSVWDPAARAKRHLWKRTHVLWLVRESDLHGLGLFWNEDWQFLGWYVNLQAPVAVHGDRFDTTDWDLDIWVEPDGSWEWKDEDGFAEAQALDILDEAAAAEVRAEGERVIAAKPWPTGWEDWRPPPEWGPLELPGDWHVV